MVSACGQCCSLKLEVHAWAVHNNVGGFQQFDDFYRAMLHIVRLCCRMVKVTSEQSSGRATIIPALCGTYVNSLLPRQCRPLPAVLSGPASTTATHCCSVLLLESLINYRGLKTTSLALSVSSANVSVPNHCYSHCTCLLYTSPSPRDS